jgi:sugar phosphate isomerase/epimerase
MEVIRSMNRRQLLSTAFALPLASELSQPGLSAEPTPKLHFRPGLVAYSYRKQLAAKSLKYEELIHRVADWGLDGLDCTVYWFPDLPNTPNEYLASLRKTAFKSGVQIYNAGVRVQLAQPTAELQKAEFENIRKWVDMTERLGASHMRVFGGKVPNGASEEQAIAWAVEVLKRGAEYAGTRGITIGVEDDGGLTIAAKPTVEIVRQTASPWAGINADSGNLRTNGYAQFEMMVPYATSVHLKTLVTDENGRKEPADWNRLLTMLEKVGYRGYIGLEYEGDNADADVPRYAENLRTLIRKVSE